MTISPSASRNCLGLNRAASVASLVGRRGREVQRGDLVRSDGQPLERDLPGQAEVDDELSNVVGDGGEDVATRFVVISDVQHDGLRVDVADRNCDAPEALATCRRRALIV